MGVTIAKDVSAKFMCSIKEPINQINQLNLNELRGEN